LAFSDKLPNYLKPSGAFLGETKMQVGDRSLWILVRYHDYYQPLSHHRYVEPWSVGMLLILRRSMRFGINKRSTSQKLKKDDDGELLLALPKTSSANDSGYQPRHTSVTEPLGREHYSEIEEGIGYRFLDIERLERALTHRSAGTGSTLSDYERLEYLGDAVLDLLVAVLLLEAHPTAREGELSKMRAALVNTQSLAEIALELGLNKFIRLSRGELASGSASRPSVLADVFEAILGAIYRESGHDAAKEVVIKMFGIKVYTVTPQDPKTELQELLHSLGGEAPVYQLERFEGPEHNPVFESIVKVGEEILGRGTGTTKKASQQAAAAEALVSLRENSDKKN
jgi:ribonuclease III